MDVQPRELKIYEDEDGEFPFPEWLESLRDRRARAKIKARLDRVEEGNLGDCKFVGEGVFELRIDYGPGYRIYFALIEKIIVLLLCGGDKSTQERDILKSQNFWLDFKQRENAK